MLFFVKTIFKILSITPALALMFVVGVLPCLAMEGRMDKGAIQAGTPEKTMVAPGGDASKNEARKKEACQIRQKIAARQREVEAFTEKEMAMVDALNDIEVELDRMGVAISKVNKELKTVNAQMAEVMEKKKILALTIDKNRDHVGARLRALYRVKMIGRMALAPMPDSLFDFFIQQNALEKILAQDFELMAHHLADMEGLAAQSRKISALTNEKQRLEATLVKQMAVKKSDGERRRILLEEIKGKKKLGLAAVESLRRSAVALEKKMTTLALTAPGDGRDFSLSQGLLGMPVQGGILTPFGPSRNSDDSSFTFEAGIDIKADRGEPVRSVFKGEVIYAEWLKGYGNLIIINHGDNFYTLYAHVQEFFKKKGERVDTDEVIALAGDTGSIRGACLHFEVRHHGRPMDPMKWLKKGA